MKKENVIDGYWFSRRADYERALKERETVAYLRANTDMSDNRAVYKIYKTSVEKKSFQTVFGLAYLGDLRAQLIRSGTVTEDMLEPIPASAFETPGSDGAPGTKKAPEAGKASPAAVETADKHMAEKYKEAYEKAKAGSTVETVMIAALVVLIVGMVIFTYQSKYSVFTYFTDYKEKMREELVDEYKQWENELEEKEKELEQKQEQSQPEQGQGRQK